MDTVLIFDWDDTLLPTTWLHKTGIIQGGPTSEHITILEAISTSVITLLTEAQKYGTVKIVTNAEKGWVESSCRKFLPRCSSLLTSIPIFSARGTYEWLYPESPYMWKILAFQIVTINYSQVISIGDNNAERHAVKELNDSFRTKSVKLEETPSMETFTKQLEALPTVLADLVAHDGDLDVYYDPYEV